ncbi:MAG TPA: DUF2169 domain-containing protein [Xanthomonadaceae bacterium]
MKIVKPLTLGVLQQPYRYRGVHRLAVATLGFFALGRDDERLLVENLQWPKVLKQIPAGQALDHILPKAHAEVMLSGCAHAPKPVPRMQVRMQCGPIDKRVDVIGDRRWERMWYGRVCIHAPKSFTTMPLSADRAYGGEGHDNPLGTGYLPRWWALRMRGGAMPNLELPGKIVVPGRNDFAVAGFAPQALMHARRRMRASGTYDKRWLAEDFPGLPRDFDFALYNLSPPDQQFAGRFVGGEAYRLEGVHASGQAIAGTLPSIRPRAFVLDQGRDAADARELALACDTVWFFPEVGVGLMVHRGEIEVRDSDALDVAALMVGYDAADRVRDAAHYRKVFALRLDPETAGLHAFDESQLAPVRSPRAQAEREAARERARAAQMAKRQAVLDATMAEFWHRSGMSPPPGYVPPVAEPSSLPSLDEDALDSCDFDLVELQAQAKALAEQAKRDAGAKLATLQHSLKARLPEAPPVAAKSVEALVQEALDRAAKPAHDLIGEPTPLPKPLQGAFAQAREAGVDPARLDEAAATLATLAPLQRAARTASPTPTTLDAPPPDPVAQALGAQLLSLLRAGTPVIGRDFAGACLRGADLRGADLREVQLERADLSGACLAGADLSKAAMTQARLDGADLSGARLAGANLCGSSARAATFAGAVLQGAHAMDARWQAADLHGAVFDDALMLRIDLSDARLDDTSLERTILMHAIAPRSRWVGSRWSMSVAASADFTGACFDGASLARSVLMDAVLVGSHWRGATLRTVYAGGRADWRGAQLSLLRAQKCGWRGSDLRDACLDGATLASCDFGDADLSGASLRGAQLYRSLFMRSTLSRVDATGASFFQALCRKADFRDADLRNAVLVQADMAEAVLDGAQLAGARRDQPVGVA